MRWSGKTSALATSKRWWSTTGAQEWSLAFFVGAGMDSESHFFQKPEQESEPEFSFMNRSVLLWFKQAIPANWIGVKQELEFKIFEKTGSRAGAGVKLVRVWVESESKYLDSDHLCMQVLFTGKKLVKNQLLLFTKLRCLSYPTSADLFIG